LSPFILKVASRCNLNCSYCYVYNKEDTSWRGRPALMSEETFDATLKRIAEHCRRSGQRSVSIIFHGGEPTLVRPVKFAAMCAKARERLGPFAEVSLSVQTNGTQLDDGWIEILREHDVAIGISLDGPRDVHDKFRVDHKGRGSYDAVARSIERLHCADVPFGILSVVQPGADPLRIHRHFLELGGKSISYLLPAETYETIGPIREMFGSTPCADFLIPIFDEWWENGTIDVRIREFWEMGRAILGGISQLDSVGNPAIRFVSVETDGSIHGLEKLKTCEDGMTDTELTVHDADFMDIARLSSLHAAVMEGMPLPSACRACPERATCGGGYLPTRYSRERGFDNPSVWCADLLALFGHIRTRLGVSPEETLARRATLRHAVAV
jgi:uncharacterized protein